MPPHADRPIPASEIASRPGWSARDGRHTQGQVQLVELAQRFGTPFYAVSSSAVDTRIQVVRAALPAACRLLYAVKANPQAALLARIAPQVDGFDIASGGELTRALDAGMDGMRLSFAGPGKTDDELAQAAKANALIVLESASEAQRLAAIAGASRPRVALRVNPPFELSPAAARMAGGARKFGVDSELAAQVLREIRELPLRFEGLHCYAGSQCLDAEAIVAAQRAIVDLAAELAPHAPGPLRTLNLGGGFGIPQFAGESPLDLAYIGKAMAALTRDAQARLPDIRLTLELGRYLVAEAGVYVCRVVERKVSRGRIFLIVDGGLNHHWHATGALEGRRDLHFPLAILPRGGNTDDNAGADAVMEVVTVAGPLCAPHDVFAQDIKLPRAEPGDLVVVLQSGAYGASASPAGFLGRPPAAEILV